MDSETSSSSPPSLLVVLVDPLLNSSGETEENINTSIHAFNSSPLVNRTVIENDLKDNNCVTENDCGLDKNCELDKNCLIDKNCELDKNCLIDKNSDVLDKNSVVVIDKDSVISLKTNSCEGSDSGVEVLETPDLLNLERTLSSPHGFDTLTPAPSCDSSIISCCSNYDDAYALLVRRNSTLIEDYKLKRRGDGTSENGSESSSVKSTKISKRKTTGELKKKVNLVEGKTTTSNTTTTSSSSSSSSRMLSAPIGGRISRVNNCIPISARGKSMERSTTPKSRLSPNSQVVTRTKATPDNLSLALSTACSNKPTVRRSLVRTSSTNRTPSATPTDDGRWPSINSKPAPLMTRSFRGGGGTLEATTSPLPAPPTVSSSTKSTTVVRVTNLQSDTKNTLEKYATLPRRRKERSSENLLTTTTATVVVLGKKPKSRESSVTRPLVRRQSSRETTPARVLPPFPKKRTKTKMYHEFSVQTVLTGTDVALALAGVEISAVNPQAVELCSVGIQADRRLEEVERLQEELRVVREKAARLQEEFDGQRGSLEEVERLLRDERVEKEGLRTELRSNSERVFAILGCDNSETQDQSDSLMVLETKFNSEQQLILKQEKEISELNSYCRNLQKNLDKSLASQENLVQHSREQRLESDELLEFLQAEKTTLCEALKDSESENNRFKSQVAQRDKEISGKETEYKHIGRLSEQRRQENLGLQARQIALEAKCRELLVHQGSAVSGAAVALTALISRLEGLIEELISSYNISEQELEDVIFHNEAYSNSSSSPDATPDTNKRFIAEKEPSSPKRASSFVSAVINAIKNAAAQSPFAAGNRDMSKDDLTDNSDSAELLDSETEPCLMMEHVLEDVIVPDNHTHNMISSSSGHNSLLTSVRLTQSESLHSLSAPVVKHSYDNKASSCLDNNIMTSSSVTPTTNNMMMTNSSNNMMTSSINNVSLVDQVIYVDNLVTRLLKVIRIIQLENEAYTTELLEERESFAEQAGTQRETNRVVVKQLRDWEVLGAQLKREVEQLLQQLSRKNGDMEELRRELSHQRDEVEKLNTDVCELSTALSKAKQEGKVTDEELAEIFKKLQISEGSSPKDVLSRLNESFDEVSQLKEQIVQKDKQLNELSQEFSANRQVLTENLKEAVSEAKRQYDAIDNALETLHGIQSVVHQCPPLANLQRELEEISFQSASEMPLVVPSGDYNANAGLLQVELSSPIKTTA